MNTTCSWKTPSTSRGLDILGWASAALLLTSSACAPLPEGTEPAESLASHAQAVESENGLAFNGLAFNGHLPVHRDVRVGPLHQPLHPGLRPVPLSPTPPGRGPSSSASQTRPAAPPRGTA